MKKNKPSRYLRVQVFFRAYRMRTNLARVVYEYDENRVLAWCGRNLWHLRRPGKHAPWKGSIDSLANHYLAMRYPGYETGNSEMISVWDALGAARLIPSEIVDPPPNESLYELGKRLRKFGVAYWHGTLPYDSREHVALLLVQLGKDGAVRYLVGDRHRMVVLCRKGDVYRRACELLASEIGPFEIERLSQ